MGNDIIIVTLINSGYESDISEIHISIPLARKLILLLERLKAEHYRVVGSETTTYALDYIEVKVVTEDKESE